MGDVGDKAFYAGDISGTITDIIMGDCYDMFYGATISGTIDNITTGDVTNNVFYASNSISESTINNVTTGDVTNYLLYAVLNITGKISYVKSNGNISTGGSGYFAGNLINCELDCRTKSKTVVSRMGSSAEIERCKLLSDSGWATITAPIATTASIVYTITNRGFTLITASQSPNYNIDDVSAI